MLDIIILYFLCNHIKNIVVSKGYNGRPWIWRTIGLWLLGEMVGIAIPLLLGKDTVIVVLSGLLCAIAAFLFVRNRALNLPDIRDKEDWLDQMGRQDKF